jgi:hypothetical protein
LAAAAAASARGPGLPPVKTFKSSFASNMSFSPLRSAQRLSDQALSFLVCAAVRQLNSEKLFPTNEPAFSTRPGI